MASTKAIAPAMWGKTPGWEIFGREADRFTLRNTDHRSTRAILVRSSPQLASVIFQLAFGIRFGLEKTPGGVFGRLLMRNHDLRWPAWSVVIDQSCEAQPWLVARVPRLALDDVLFGVICDEMLDEANAFHKELHDKFDYLRGWTPPVQDGAGVPARQGGTDIQYCE